MTLQGTLDTFALPDVLRLLATTRKTGRLVVKGTEGDGSLYLDEGGVVGGETSLAPTDESHEVLFELLRVEGGSFVFEQDATSDAAGDTVEVEALIEAAETAHAEWQDLSTVVPSLDVGVVLVEDLPVESTTVDRDRWRLIVAIGGGTTVRALGGALGLKELPILRATRALIDDGLGEIVEGIEVVRPPVDANPLEVTDTVAAPEGDIFDDRGYADGGPFGDDGDDLSGGSSLPSLDDETDAVDLFEGSAGVLPEPLPDGSVGAVGPSLSPDEAATLEKQIESLAPEHRALVEQAAESNDPNAAADLLASIPEGSIDGDLMRRFLGAAGG
ncbi:MAG: DUF4388 domain-containing protein [Actinobacteria bacterium]|nr:DUF4388 domain-containing protein [Actinomycetota bacterium]